MAGGCRPLSWKIPPEKWGLGRPSCFSWGSRSRLRPAQSSIKKSQCKARHLQDHGRKRENESFQKKKLPSVSQRPGGLRTSVSQGDPGRMGGGNLVRLGGGGGLR